MGVEDLLHGYFGDKVDFIYRDFERVKIKPVGERVSSVYEAIWDPIEISRIVAEDLKRGDSTHWYVRNHDHDGKDVQTEVLTIKYSEIKFLRSQGKNPAILSANGIFRTDDGYLIVQRRSEELDDEAGKIHTYGGSMNTGERIEQTVWREFGEEAFSRQLKYSPVTSASLSFLECKNGYLQELYVIDLPISLDEFKRTKNPNWEGDPIVIRDGRDELYEFLAQGPKAFVAEGYAGLVKYVSKYHDNDGTDLARSILYGSE